MSGNPTAAAEYYIETALRDPESGLGVRVLFVPKHFLGDVSPADAAVELARALGADLKAVDQGAFAKAVAALLYEDEFVRDRGIDAFYASGPARPGESERTAAEAILKSKIVVEHSPPELQLLSEIVNQGHLLVTGHSAYSSFAIIQTALVLYVVCPMGKGVGKHVGDAIGTIIADLIFALRDAIFPALKRRGGGTTKGFAKKKAVRKKTPSKVTPMKRKRKALPPAEEKKKPAAAAAKKVASAKKTRKKAAAPKKTRKVAAKKKTARRRSARGR